MNKLKRLAAERTHQLEQSKWLHAFLRESTDLEDWIEDQMQLANSEEYGSDYEHLLVGRLVSVSGYTCSSKLGC